MGVSDSTRVIGAVHARGSMGPRSAAFALVSILLFAGFSLALGPSSAAGAPPATLETQAPIPGPVADGAARIQDIPEYFVSPVTGDAYRILKDPVRGTYLYCAGDGQCSPTPGEVMEREAKGLPAWAVVVEPALRDRIARAGPGSNEETRVIVELRDATFARIAADAWARVGPELRALEGRAALFADRGVSDVATMERIDALDDGTRNEIYVRADSELSPLISEVGLAVADVGGSAGGYTPVLPAVFARIPLASIPAFAGNPWVGRISESRPVQSLMDVSALAIRSDTWWTNGYTGGTWDAAVMDTGIDPTHPALAVDQAAVFHALGQTNPFYGDQPTNPDDLHGHGTHVAGTVASTDTRYRGVAYGLDQLINVKAGWRTTGGGGVMYPEDGMTGVDWAVGTAGADVVSLSFGGGVNIGDTPWERYFDAVIDDLGVAVAIAAGNGGPGARTVGEPGAGFNILSVGAMNDQNTVSRTDDAIESFSSRGPTGDGRLKPDITAPGVDIVSANAFWEGGNPNFVSASGTSMATPHIAAVHVLLMNGIGSTFPPRYKALLLNSAEDKGTAGPDTANGWGYVDLARAFTERSNVREGNVTDGPVHYVFYRGAAAAGDRATLAWNRHATHTGPTYPTTFFPLNDLDLISYDEAGGNRIAVSMRTVDNVEQVVAPAASASMVYKVHVPGTLSGVTQEHYAIALPPGTSPIGPPSLSAAISGPATMEMGTPFTITSNVTNTGGLAAQSVSATLTLPAGLTLVSGANPQNIGRIPAGGLGTASWQVAGTTLGPKTATADATSTSYEETFSAASGPYSVVIVDSVQPTSSVNSLPAYTTTAAFTVAATASDLGGVASVELFFRKGGGADTTYGIDTAAPWTWSFDTTGTGGDGFYQFYSVATDVATNRETPPATPDASTSVDTAPPTSAMYALPTYETVATFNVTSNASDLGGTVSEVSFYVRPAGGPWSLLGTDTAEPWSWTFDSAAAGGDGLYQFYSIATDVIGNREAKIPAPEASTTVDTVAPSTARALAGTAGVSPWYVSSVTVTLTPSDATSGVLATQFRIDGGTWLPYAMPLSLTADGTHTVEFSSSDIAGNAEAMQSVSVSLDATAPTTTGSLGGTQGAIGWFSSVVTVTLTATDLTSGIDVVEVQIDGGGWMPYTGPVPVATEGGHGVAFRSLDLAGNAESVQLVQFQVDRTPPTSGHVASGTQGGGGWIKSAVTVILSGTDALSGVAGIGYRLDGGAWLPYAGAFVADSEGAHSVDFRATDVAGNVEATNSFEFKIDTIAPEVAIAEPSAGAVVRGPWVSLTWSASDTGSGVDACTVGIDGGIRVPSDGPTSHAFPNVGDGPHVVAVTCTDIAGNHRATSADFSVTSGFLGALGGNLWLFLLLGLLVSAFAILLLVAARRRTKEEKLPVGVAPVTGAMLPPPPPAEPIPPPPMSPPPPPPPDDPPPPPLPPPPPPS